MRPGRDPPDPCDAAVEPARICRQDVARDAEATAHATS